MPSVSTSVFVSRPDAEVFDFLADARNLALWSSGVTSVDDAAVPPAATPPTATATREGAGRTSSCATTSSPAAA